ncbi:MAG: PepSY domain-containing protein, partial [Gemmatimonadaceae bacterium]|nr:PepSY domain-containing protein [Gemmatimonadaceae bacterium]
MNTEVQRTDEASAYGADRGRGPRTTAPNARRRSVRPALRRLHRWLGVAAGVLLVVTGLSGSVLVFRREIDAALNPRLLRAEPAASRVPLQRILNGVRRQYPDVPPTRVRMPRSR